MSSAEFKADMAKMTEVLGLSHHKNAPRSINALINPYGFVMKAGKISLAATPEPAAQDSVAASPAAASAGDDGADGSPEASEPPKKKTAARAVAGKGRKALPTKAMRKRKIDEVKEDDDDVKEEDGGKDEDVVDA
ncbi:hypothetical protein SLS62_010702 [Diatrype stigma]|uniref:Uncharacterized protein n=1 Tax=Diatrype stigma TaxID=117547 RepID=A0AAN9U829_9PEZI